MAEQAIDKNVDKKARKAAAKEAKKAAKKAKKDNPDLLDDEEEETVGGKIFVGFVAIIIVAIWLLILALLVKMDVGGFGSTVLYPILKDVPVVNKILPEVTEYAEEDSAYAYDTIEEAVARIKELETELADAQSSSSVTDAQIAELEAQAAELQEYKDAEAEFEETKEKFYEEVVFSEYAPDIEEYKAYYESIEPTNAEAIYKQVVETLQEDEELSDYAQTYAEMKPADAAAILDTMTDNLELVGKILWAMDTESRADILGEMDTDIAAAVTELMEP